MDRVPTAWVASTLETIPQHRTDNRSNGTGFAALARSLDRDVLLQRMRQTWKRQRLQPHATGAGKLGQEDTVTAEEHVLDARDRGDLEVHIRVEGADVAGMDTQDLSGLKIFDHQLTRKLQPGRALTAHTLQDEAAATKDTGTQRLLEADAELYLRGRTEEAVPMDQVLVTGRNLHRNDVSRNLGRKSHLARIVEGPVLGHEERSAAGHTLDRAEETAAASELRMSLHLDALRHPGEFSSFRDHGFAGLEQELENRHGGSGNTALHGDGSPPSSGFYAGAFKRVP